MIFVVDGLLWVIAIALALIVLFAIISIMLFQSMSKSLTVDGLTSSQKDAVVKENPNRVLAVIPQPCRLAANGTDCEAGSEERYSVHLLQPPGHDSAALVSIEKMRA